MTINNDSNAMEVVDILIQMALIDEGELVENDFIEFSNCNAWYRHHKELESDKLQMKKHPEGC